MSNDFLLSVMALMLAGVLVGCQKPAPPKSLEPPPSPSKEASPTQTLQKLDDNLAQAGEITNPKAVVFETIPLAYTLPKSLQAVCQATELADEGQIACPVIAIELAKSKPEFIAQVVNRAISEDDNPKLLKFKQNLDSFAMEQLESESTMAFEKQIGIERLPDYQQLVQIAITNEVFMGGAHGSHSLQYKLFDMNLQSEIGIDDLLLKDVFIDGVLERAYDEALLTYFDDTRDNTSDIAEHKQNYPLFVSDNVYFDDKGLVFAYNPYELGPYAMGNVSLVVPFERLDGVVKPDYLP